MSIHRPRAPVLFLCLGVLLAVLAGCGPSATESVEAQGAAEGAGTAEQPAQTAAAQPQPPQQTWLAASHILIQYVGASGSAPDVTRTQEEALTLAGELAAKARAGEEIGELAKQHSDDPSAPKGGSLGVFPTSRMVPAFSAACAMLGIGEVSDPVETQFGYHVIRRDREVELVSARHMLVMHTKSARVPPGVTRTKDEAFARASEALKKARLGDDFAELAAEYSDGPTKVKGGDLGSFPQGAMVPAFDEVVFALKVGAISDIVETQFGFHIIMRYE